AALNWFEKFRRFVIRASIRSGWIHLSTLSEFAGPLQKKLASYIRNTGHLLDPPRAVGVIVPSIGIRVGKAFIGRQMLTGLFSPSAGGELVPHRRRCRARPSCLIPSVDPQPRGFGLVLSFSIALLEQLDRGVIYYPTGDCFAICREGIKIACASKT
ncbi:MAG: hypothetical protein ACI9PU_002168, partial [Ascidiaceihabitans sp.]